MGCKWTRIKRRFVISTAKSIYCPQYLGVRVWIAGHLYGEDPEPNHCQQPRQNSDRARTARI